MKREKIIEILKDNELIQPIQTQIRGVFPEVYNKVADEIISLTQQDEPIFIRGLRKWGFKEKLSFDEAYELLHALQTEIVNPPKTEN